MNLINPRIIPACSFLHWISRNCEWTEVEKWLFDNFEGGINVPGLSTSYK